MLDWRFGRDVGVGCEAGGARGRGCAVLEVEAGVVWDRFVVDEGVSVRLEAVPFVSIAGVCSIPPCARGGGVEASASVSATGTGAFVRVHASIDVRLSLTKKSSAVLNSSPTKPPAGIPAEMPSS